HLPAADGRLESPGRLPSRGSGGSALARHRGLPAEVVRGVVHRQSLLALELDLPGGDPGQGPPLVREEREWNRALQVRGVPARLALGREEEPGLLGHGQAVPRRLPRDLHQGSVRPGGGRILDEERARSEEHTSELQSRFDLVCRLLLEKKTRFGRNIQRPLSNDSQTISSKLSW